jgi:plasmid stabilization system protein ParE
MKLVITPRAKDDIRQQLAYSAEKFGEGVAERAFERIFSYFENVLVKYPRAASFDPALKAFASWIPKTPFIVIYRLDEAADMLVIVAMLHHAQDRSSLESEE